MVKSKFNINSILYLFVFSVCLFLYGCEEKTKLIGSVGLYKVSHVEKTCYNNGCSHYVFVQSPTRLHHLNVTEVDYEIFKSIKESNTPITIVEVFKQEVE